MPASDLLARLGGFMLLMSSLWNGFLSFIWVFAMIWVCVGVIWLIPMVLAVVTFGIGIAALAMGHQKWTIAGPILSMIVSMCNFNVFGFMMDFVSLALFAGSMYQRQQEEQAGLL